jgi:hypothetical protein
MAVSFDLGAKNVPIEKAFEFLGAHFLSDEHPDDGLADRLEAIRDLIEDISSLVGVMEDRQSMPMPMPMPTPYSGACQPMGPTTPPNAAVAALVPFASGGAFRAPPELPEAPGRAKRHREGEEQEEDCAPTKVAKKGPCGTAPREWVAPSTGARRHFTHYVLHNMVYRVPMTDKRQAYEVRFGCWKKDDFKAPYLQAHPKTQDPESLWNGRLPGGLETFWKKATEIIEGKRTMEADNRNEADVTAWVEEKVLGLSGMTAEDRRNWGHPAANAVTLPSTALSALSALCPLLLRVLHFQQGPSLIVRAPAGRRRRSPRAFFSSSGQRRNLRGDRSVLYPPAFSPPCVSFCASSISSLIVRSPAGRRRRSPSAFFSSSGRRRNLRGDRSV